MATPPATRTRSAKAPAARIRTNSAPEPTSETTSTRRRDSGAHQRTPWTGNLTPEELVRPGGMLLAALVKCANERRQSMAEMAAEVGVSYGYICQLRNGDRKVSAASEAFTLGCALYLGIPHVTVLVMAGKLGEKDFYELNETPARDLVSAMEVISNDAEYGHLLTPEIREGSVETRYAVVRLYEAATGKRLLPERVDLGRIIQSVRTVEELREQRLQQLAELRARNASAA